MRKKISTLLISLLLLMSFLTQTVYGDGYTAIKLADGIFASPGGFFHEGLCRVSNYQKDGFIDTEGKLVIPLKYTHKDHLGSFSEGLCALNIDGKLCYLDKKGNIALKTQYSFAADADWDYYDERNAIEFKETLGNFVNGRAAVRNTAGKWGFIDKTGSEVIPCQYDAVENFVYGVALVWKNKRYQVITTSGDNVLKQEYISVRITPGGIIMATNDTSYNPEEEHSGFTLEKWYSYDAIDYSGNVMQNDIPIDPDLIFKPAYIEGGYRIEMLSHESSTQTSTYAVYNKSGDLIYTTDQFSSISEAHKGISCVWLAGFSNKRNYLDVATGKLLLAEPADGCMEFNDGYGVFWRGDKSYLVDKQGKIIDFSPYESQNSYAVSEGIILLREKDNGNFVLGKLPSTQSETKPATYAAAPSAAKVLVNGSKIEFDAYTINNNNYFKLRDLAYALNGDEKGFEVTWNDEKNTIELVEGQKYTDIGGELSVGDGRGKGCTLSTSKLYLDGRELTLTAYNIGGNNYYKLRDVMKAFDIAVGWDEAASTITVDTTLGYQE